MLCFALLAGSGDGDGGCPSYGDVARGVSSSIHWATAKLLLRVAACSRAVSSCSLAFLRFQLQE